MFDTTTTLVPLAASCTDALDCWSQGEFFEALTARIDVVLGMAAFMLIVGVCIYVALYWWSKSYVVPTTVLVLSGGAILSTMPAVVQRIGWIVILLAGALGLFGVMWAVIR